MLERTFYTASLLFSALHIHLKLHIQAVLRLGAKDAPIRILWLISDFEFDLLRQMLADFDFLKSCDIKRLNIFLSLHPDVSKHLFTFRADVMSHCVGEQTV
ncbi:hypothetical protein CHARACLAT_006513 [Characodon lateralis]|uniref:Uncharacterized protein n=1 Tax=Characodon lateralis TaxID=208331 RepID=A0ABU7E1I6_9TELE|nr:hypothetical protein [Characodon lateralis]